MMVVSRERKWEDGGCDEEGIGSPETLTYPVHHASASSSTYFCFVAVGVGVGTIG